MTEPNAEFYQLLQDARAHLAYLRELGITHINDDGNLLADALEAAPATSDSTVNAPRVDAPPLARTNPALQRNAAAIDLQATTDRASPLSKSASTPNPASSSNAQDARRARYLVPPSPLASVKPVLSSSPPVTATDKAAIRNSHAQPIKTETTPPVMTKQPDPTPLAQNSLFGEITPADELSLPQSDETLEDIRRDIGDCTRCPLYEGRTNIVHTEGGTEARLMFVGEAPGADEDASGRPFVGRAGQLLNKIIEAIGLKREDVLIGNVNRCRPPGNRTPTLQEAKTCKPFLLRDIAATQPDIIVVMGNTAMKNLLDTKEGITKLRGEFQDYKGIKVMPTFHPAYLLRDPSKKRETWDDMKKVRDYLQANPRQETKPEAQAQDDLGLEQRDE